MWNLGALSFDMRNIFEALGEDDDESDGDCLSLVGESEAEYPPPKAVGERKLKGEKNIARVAKGKCGHLECGIGCCTKKLGKRIKKRMVGN